MSKLGGDTVNMNLTQLLYQLEEICDKCRRVRTAALQLGFSSNEVDDLQEQLDNLYEQLQAYTDIVCQAAQEYMSHGGAL